MTDDPLTTGEIAANLLGAKGVAVCICAWVDEEGRAIWYKIGSSLTAVGLLRTLARMYEEEMMGDDDD